MYKRQSLRGREADGKTPKRRDAGVDAGVRWLLSRVGEDWAALAPRVARESEQARAAEEALKKERVERGRAARNERLASEARGEERSVSVKGFELDDRAGPASPASPSRDAEPVSARVAPGAFGSPVDDAGSPR